MECCCRPTSLPHIIAGQWLNQTQNAAITWCNRPPPPVESTQEQAQTNARLSETARAVAAYVAACATAIPIAVGAGLGANRSPLLRPLGKFAPYPAVALANVVNTCMMRSDDLVSGVPVTTDGADTTVLRSGDPSLRDSGRYATPHSRGLSFRWQTLSQHLSLWRGSGVCWGRRDDHGAFLYR